MARFLIVALLASSPITYLYEDAGKALAKVRTLQRLMAEFELKDGTTQLPLSVDELERRSRRG